MKKGINKNSTGTRDIYEEIVEGFDHLKKQRRNRRKLSQSEIAKGLDYDY